MAPTASRRRSPNSQDPQFNPDSQWTFHGRTVAEFARALVDDPNALAGALADNAVAIAVSTATSDQTADLNIAWLAALNATPKRARSQSDLRDTYSNWAGRYNGVEQLERMAEVVDVIGLLASSARHQGTPLSEGATKLADYFDHNSSLVLARLHDRYDAANYAQIGTFLAHYAQLPDDMKQSLVLIAQNGARMNGRAATKVILRLADAVEDHTAGTTDQRRRAQSIRNLLVSLAGGAGGMMTPNHVLREVAIETVRADPQLSTQIPPAVAAKLFDETPSEETPLLDAPGWTRHGRAVVRLADALLRDEKFVRSRPVGTAVVHLAAGAWETRDRRAFDHAAQAATVRLAQSSRQLGDLYHVAVGTRPSPTRDHALQDVARALVILADAPGEGALERWRAASDGTWTQLISVSCMTAWRKRLKSSQSSE